MTQSDIEKNLIMLAVTDQNTIKALDNAINKILQLELEINALKRVVYPKN